MVWIFRSEQICLKRDTLPMMLYLEQAFDYFTAFDDEGGCTRKALGEWVAAIPGRHRPKAAQLVNGMQDWFSIVATCR